MKKKKSLLRFDIPKLDIGQKIDKVLLFEVLGLLAFGIIAVYNSSSVIATYEFNDKYYFLKEQLKWVFVGGIALFISSMIPYKKWYNLAIFLLIISIILLAIVLIPGIGVVTKGAKRWLFFGGQPSEFAKLSLVIYLSAWFSSKEKGRLWAFLILCGIIVGLIILQPDMGTAVVLGLTALIMYFLSGAPIWHFLLLLPLSGIAGFLLIKIAPYRFNRLLSFLNSEIDPLGMSYHIRQVLIAIGSGGLWGLGLGKSRQKFSYVPESTTDSIFAIIGEELGFIGAAILILAFFIIVYRGMKIAGKAPDEFGKLLAAGITSWLGLQTIINLSAMVALIPLTGVPLPLISYGGSALTVNLFAIGILLNISKYIKQN